MAKIKQHPVPVHALPALKQSDIRIKKYRSAASFEKDLLKFIQRNEVLHLCTQRKGALRATPVGYKAHGFTFYVFTEGGGKIANLKENKNVAFSIAEPFRLADDFWAYKGIQVWGKAKVYSKNENPDQFEKAFNVMDLKAGPKKLRVNDLSPHFNHKIIEIIPTRIKYTNPREGIFRITWER